MELILIRHGTTQGNKERRFIGTLDIPLAPEGEELARQVSPTLPAVDHVYRSPLIRCRQTADFLWPQAEKTVIPQLRETNFGPFEGKNHEELKDDPLYQQWITTADFAKLPVGESVDEVLERSSQGLRNLIADAKAHGYERVGVVSHGGTLMALLWKFGRPERDYYDWMCANCGGFRVKVHEEPLYLEILETVGGGTLCTTT